MMRMTTTACPTLGQSRELDQMFWAERNRLRRSGRSFRPTLQSAAVAPIQGHGGDLDARTYDDGIEQRMAAPWMRPEIPPPSRNG